MMPFYNNLIKVEPDPTGQEASLGKLSAPDKCDTGSDSPGAGGADEPLQNLPNMYGQLVAVRRSDGCLYYGRVESNLRGRKVLEWKARDVEEWLTQTGPALQNSLIENSSKAVL